MNLNARVIINSDEKTYEDFCNKMKREQNDSREWLPREYDRWIYPVSLRDKIGTQGDMEPFFGDTVVFKVDCDTKKKLEKMQCLLHERLEKILAKKLSSEHLHMTLHDLNNSKGKTNELSDNMKQNKEKCRELFEQIIQYIEDFPEYSKIRMKPTMLYPSVNISVVMGLIPSTEKDYNILMNLYNSFNDIVDLKRILRPHITLSYFKPYDLSKEEKRELYNVLKSLDPSCADLEIEFDLKDLAYQTFENMDFYEDIMQVKNKDLGIRVKEKESSRGNFYPC